MDVAVTGSHGLIGSALIAALRRPTAIACCGSCGRTRSAPDDVRWDPRDGCDRLARSSKASTRSCTSRARASATRSGRPRASSSCSRAARRAPSLLARALAGLTRKPSVLVSASAIGYYGDRGDECSPRSRRRATTSARTCAASGKPRPRRRADAGIRVVRIRTGLVQAGSGGMLHRLAAAVQARRGRSPRFGQAVHELDRDRRRSERDPSRPRDAVTSTGPVNLTAPNPVTNAEYTATLGRVLHRPDGDPDAAVRVEGGVRRGARRHVAREPARLVGEAPGERLRVRVPRPRGRAPHGDLTRTV